MREYRWEPQMEPDEYEVVNCPECGEETLWESKLGGDYCDTCCKSINELILKNAN